MQTSAITSSSASSAHAAAASNFTPSAINGRPDLDFAAALQKVSPQAQAKAKTTATDFEAMFLNSMFAQMTSGLKGEGPYGDTVGTGVWRSMLTEQYSKTFAQAGGVGIASDVYRTLILQQAKTTSNGTN
jgi:peptidoglycan hydrolase FlgJ